MGKKINKNKKQKQNKNKLKLREKSLKSTITFLKTSPDLLESDLKALAYFTSEGKKTWKASSKGAKKYIDMPREGEESLK